MSMQEAYNIITEYGRLENQHAIKARLELIARHVTQ